MLTRSQATHFRRADKSAMWSRQSTVSSPMGTSRASGVVLLRVGRLSATWPPLSDLRTRRRSGLTRSRMRKPKVPLGGIRRRYACDQVYLAGTSGSYAVGLPQMPFARYTVFLRRGLPRSKLVHPFQREKLNWNTGFCHTYYHRRCKVERSLPGSPHSSELRAPQREV